MIWNLLGLIGMVFALYVFGEFCVNHPETFHAMVNWVQSFWR